MRPFIQERVEFTYFMKHHRMLLAALGHGSHAIHDLLIQPVQRIPRYRLLLEQLLKSTPGDHPDTKLLKDALNKASSLYFHRNEGDGSRGCRAKSSKSIKRAQVVRSRC